MRAVAPHHVVLLSGILEDVLLRCRVDHVDVDEAVLCWRLSRQLHRASRVSIGLAKAWMHLKIWITCMLHGWLHCEQPSVSCSRDSLQLQIEEPLSLRLAADG